MPYDDVSQIPSYIKKYPAKVQRQFMHVFNSVYKRTEGDEGAAFKAANAVISRHLEKFTDNTINFAYQIDKFLGVLGDK